MDIRDKIRSVLSIVPDLPNYVCDILNEWVCETRTFQMTRINTWVNGELYRSDWDMHGEVDRWATPHEFFGSGGDCEDFAVGKYHCLSYLGWSLVDMRIVVVDDHDTGKAHAVLYVKHRGSWWVLDNQYKRPMKRGDLEGIRYEPRVVGGSDMVYLVGNAIGIEEALYG